MAGFTEDGETLETLLNKATNPTNRDDDWEYIMAFCDRVNKEHEGPQVAAQLLSHKIQSPQERESLQALATTEACVKNCGEFFHREIGKFRFLNELIRLISPKYLGGKTKDSVKKRIIELIYSWSKGIPDQPKIKEAYDMLKKQGLVKEDPTYMDKIPLDVGPPRPKQAVFEDEDKSKLLARLLKSKHPEDLQAANRLIKNMVKDHEKTVEKVSHRLNEIEKCTNNVKLLSEMLEHYTPEVTSPQEKELMKELYISCEKMRPNLFRLASSTDDKEDGIGEILEANDKLTKVMELYRAKIGEVIVAESSDSSSVHGVGDAHQRGQGGDSSSLIDLDGLDSTPAASNDLTVLNSSYVSGSGAVVSGIAPNQNSVRQPTSDALLEQQLSSLGLGVGGGVGTVPVTTQSAAAMQLDAILGTGITPSTTSNFATFPPVQQASGYNQPSVNMVHPSMIRHQTAPSMAHPMNSSTQITGSLLSGSTSVFNNPPVEKSKAEKPPPALSSKAFAELESLGKSMMVGQNAAVTTAQVSRTNSSSSDVDSLLLSTGPSLPSPQITSPQPMSQLPTQPISTTGPSLLQPAQSLSQAPKQTMMQSKPSGVAATVLSLADIFVPLDSIQPGVTPPLTVYEKNNVKTVFHFAKDSPRPDIQVLVVSTMSTNTSPIKGVVFQAAVPKTMRIKLQPPSATDLPVHNPILPPSAITQVMLVANPQKEKIRLKFKLQYTMDGKTVVDVGEVDKFPS
ncbi:ADP-ribosylation factor-binding protein GGA1-like [Anneissia japonica]|uniref:ADP-ribosylation factor-binding protein GGA1-like n=1 Tax=Anneissia japonica TaxID=1529436 RepID=UPI0014256FA4|nr:ADP-ribosylation factor-binding protein GGA1-like [Anneissia japonica]